MVPVTKNTGLLSTLYVFCIYVSFMDNFVGSG